MEIVCQPLTLYPSPHDMEMYSLHEREEDFFKRGLAPLCNQFPPLLDKERGIKGVRFNK